MVTVVLDWVGLVVCGVWGVVLSHGSAWWGGGKRDQRKRQLVTSFNI